MKATISQSIQFTVAMGAAWVLVGCGANKSTSSESGRLQVLNQALSIDTNGTSSVSAQSISLYTPNLSLVAAVAPPSIGGVTLQANSSQLFGLNVYIGYNLAGAASGGGLDVVSVLSPLLPVLSKTQQFATLDVNGVYGNGSSVYVTGNDSVADSPARLQSFSTSLLGGVNSQTNDVALNGYAAVAIKPDVAGTYFYVLTGNNGGLHLLNRTTLVESAPAYTAITDARDLATSAAGDIYVVTGTSSATVQKFSAAGVYQSSVSIGNAGAGESKSTIVVGSSYALATAGSNGVKLICLGNMSIIGSAPAPTGGVTNAAAFSGGLVFTADGDAGVSVYSLDQGGAIAGTTCNNATLTKLGTIAFSTYVSANHIYYSGGLLFVSAGIGGLKIVSVTLPSILTGLISSL